MSEDKEAKMVFGSLVLDDKAQSGQAFKNIARRLNGEEVPLLKLGSESTGLFSAIRRLFKKN